VKKVLIIRFSSLGDIAQALAAAQALKDKYPEVEIHWAARADMAPLLEVIQCVAKVWPLNRGEGLLGLWRLAKTLRQENFDLVYDAHSNVRSHFLSFVLRGSGTVFIRRSKERLKRFLLFKFRKNYFPKPYRGAISYLTPIKDYVSSATAPRVLLKPYTGTRAEIIEAAEKIMLAPSAAWDLKKWPVENWQKIVYFLEEQKFAILGGPDDKYLDAIRADAPDQVKNWCGQLSWAETAHVISRAPLLISGDTGALHLGDAFGTPTLAILGPSAFGHPSRPNTVTVEKDLWCRPCTKDGRGKCFNPENKKCLKDISPQEVVEAAANLMQKTSPREANL
jgi:ADP-heptose:LPS heptosyltransferase